MFSFPFLLATTKKFVLPRGGAWKWLLVMALSDSLGFASLTLGYLSLWKQHRDRNYTFQPTGSGHHYSCDGDLQRQTDVYPVDGNRDLVCRNRASLERVRKKNRLIQKPALIVPESHLVKGFVDIHVHVPIKEYYRSGGEFFLAEQKVFHRDVREVSPEEMIAEYDACGIEKIIVLGWDAETGSHLPRVPNELVASYVSHYPERMIGFASVDPLKGQQRSMS